MSWDAVGAIGEILGAVAVVMTLGYLATQVRQARKATLADIYQNRAYSRAEASRGVALNSPVFHEILFKFESTVETRGLSAALDAFEPQELFLVRQYHHDLMVRMDNVHFQFTQGFVPVEYFEHAKTGIRRFAPVWEALGIDRSYPPLSQELFRDMAREGRASED